MRNVLVILVALVLVFATINFACAENDILYVHVDENSYLRARERPSTHSPITMRLYNGDSVEVVAIHGDWIEIIGGESGTSYVSSEFVSETAEPFEATNVSGGRIRVRKTIDGKAIGYVKDGRTVTVTRTISGWGYIGTGWVMLEYFDYDIEVAQLGD